MAFSPSPSSRLLLLVFNNLHLDPLESALWRWTTKGRKGLPAMGFTFSKS
jgi:hypothetical protein